MQDPVTLSAGCMYNCTYDLQVLLNIAVPGKARKPQRIRTMCWVLPEHGEVKVNTDGAARGIPSKGGAGAVFYSHDGQFLELLQLGFLLFLVSWLSVVLFWKVWNNDQAGVGRLPGLKQILFLLHKLSKLKRFHGP
ncbi:hypothetical protein GIB67_042154 [Kingdonia uniflora]|uniref:Uncharacterized protein n=1 Tax=Kingdonia uniflora TaxID=39325 RepID=A0A7J7NWV5_9MAGN|nr:hypothetical protein GIB67_042154 [Kingdonia uniflora]